jgi:hypothetical protein
MKVATKGDDFARTTNLRPARVYPYKSTADQLAPNYERTLAALSCDDLALEIAMGKGGAGWQEAVENEIRKRRCSGT